MKNEYLCPKCRSRLRIDDYVVLSVTKQNGEKGIIFLSNVLGDYSYVKNSSLEFEKGDKVKISCPVCNENLLCVPDKNLAKVFMVNQENGNLESILFSVVFGEKITYKVSEKEGKKEIKSYGDDSVQYIDFENLTSLC